MTGLEALLDWFAAGREAAAADARREYCGARLRALPREEIFLYVKTIDNSRVRALPQRSDVMAGVLTAAVACLAALCLIAVIFPPTTTLALSHQIEALKHERAALLNELRELRSVEAGLRSAESLEQYAGERFIAPPPKALVYAPPARATVASLESRR